jgi:hypothetical protein
MRAGARWATQHPHQLARLERNVDATSRGHEVRQRALKTRDGEAVRCLHLLDIIHKDELGEVVIHRRLREVASRRQRLPLLGGSVPESSVLGSDG